MVAGVQLGGKSSSVKWKQRFSEVVAGTSVRWQPGSVKS